MPRPRFSLRALLTTVAVLAVPAAIITNGWRQSIKESRIARQLARHGLAAGYGSAFGSADDIGVENTWLATPLQKGWLGRLLVGPRVVALVPERQGVTLSDLSPLRQLTSLKVVDLNGSPIDDLTPLAECPMLECVHLEHTQVRDLRPLLRLPKLEVLTIRQTPVVDLMQLADARSLRFLTVDYHRFTSEQRLQLSRANPRIHITAAYSAEESPASASSDAASRAAATQASD